MGNPNGMTGEPIGCAWCGVIISSDLNLPQHAEWNCNDRQEALVRRDQEARRELEGMMGTASGGNVLDGRTWQQFPAAAVRS